MEMTEEQQAALEQQKAQCPFCQIIAGKIPSKKVYEDDLVIAILDIRPAAKGHVLLIPKEHYFIMPIIPPDTFKHLARKAKEISKAMKEAFLSDHTTIFVANGGAAGQQVAHFMMHIVPREKGDMLENFDVPEKEITEDERKEMVEKLKPMLTSMLEKNLAILGYKEGKAKGMPGFAQQKITKEQLLAIIEQNPQIKEIIIKNPQEFKKMVPTHPQLKQLFKDVNIDEIIEAVSGKKMEKIVDAEFTEEINENKEGKIKVEKEYDREKTKKETEKKEYKKNKKDENEKDEDDKTDLDLISKLF